MDRDITRPDRVQERVSGNKKIIETHIIIAFKTVAIAVCPVPMLMYSMNSEPARRARIHCMPMEFRELHTDRTNRLDPHHQMMSGVILT